MVLYIGTHTCVGRYERNFRRIDADSDGIVNGDELKFFFTVLFSRQPEWYDVAAHHIVGLSTKRECHWSVAYVHKADGTRKENYTEDHWFSC